MERAKGFEPSTPTLARLCSTPELRPRSVGGGLLRGFRLEGKSPSIAVTTRLPRPHFHGLCHPADTTLNTPSSKQAEDFHGSHHWSKSSREHRRDRLRPPVRAGNDRRRRPEHLHDRRGGSPAPRPRAGGFRANLVRPPQAASPDAGKGHPRGRWPPEAGKD